MLVLAACAPQRPSELVKRYQMTGEILRLDPKTAVAEIKHEDIKGWMAAMTMEYPVKDRAEFDKLHVGDKITATVFVQGSDYSIGEIRPTRR